MKLVLNKVFCVSWDKNERGAPDAQIMGYRVTYSYDMVSILLLRQLGPYG